jgi:UDP-N-acetylmuramoyl-tripeptide--D-alanyl-D-alanine ligase
VTEGSSTAPVMLTAGEVAALTEGALTRGDPRTNVRGTSIDSRAIGPGMLFVALSGSRTDGHLFVGDALRCGAAAALVARETPDVPSGAVLIRVADTLEGFHRLARGVRERLRLRVVGITGSVGKTSTKEMAAAVAAQAFRTEKSPENWNTEIGVPLVLTNMPADREVAIVEMAMRGPGQIRDLVRICRPEIGVVTSIGESHMNFFTSLDALAAAKGELIEGLPSDGVAILNADDPLVLALASRGPARLLTFGLGSADVTAQDLQSVPGVGSSFHLRIPGGAAPVTVRVPGRHAVRNALAAAAVGVALGLRADQIARGLAEAVPLQMRLEVRRVGGITLLHDVYNSSPQSVEAALDVMDEMEGSPRVAVLGDMKELGRLSDEAHRRIGRLAACRRIDLLVAFGPLAAAVAAGAREAGGPRVVHTENLEAVITLLRRELRPGAVVLVKGSRAMAMERIAEVLFSREQTEAAGGI